MVYIEWFIVWGILILLILTYTFIIIDKIKKKKAIPIKGRKYNCIDGHVVKSKGELIIDNLLNKLGIEHIYEKVIKIKGEKIKCDWYLPKYDVYIEYWGLNNKNYLKRRAIKTKLYKKGGYNLVSILDSDLQDIYNIFPKKILKFSNGKKLVFKKFCPNCGTELDSRF